MAKLLLSKSDEEYLEKCATQMKFSYGIIIGQKSEPGKYIVVHLAKNDEEESDFPDADSSATVGPQKVDQINLQSLGNQWLSAGKMIPGSFNVMGLFVAGVSKDYVDDSSDEFKSAKRLFFDMHNLLKQGHQFKSNEHDDTEYIFLTYSSAAKKAASKIYNYVANGGTFSPLDYRFVEKPFEWYTFECNYELNDVFPILDASEKINIEVQFQKTIDTVRNSLNASEIFLQNECVDDGQILDSYIKHLHQGGGRKANSDESYKATIFLPIKCQNTKGNQRIHVKEFNGTIRLSGVVSSRVWCNPKNTIGDVKRFIREDVIRSLMARIQVYCDGLTEPNISNDAIFISEPPRRVYFNVNAGSGQKSIQFSDYIFRGETPTVAAAQAKQILDLDITPDSISADLEGVPEDETFSDTSFEMPTTDKQKMQKLGSLDPAGQRDLTRTMYMLGIAVSLLVLVIAIVVHYFMK
ncbi:protein odr-4 homolog [Musca domestica]|uniref:BON domain protein n=1 Tax=Musca domestica TaxID=7370 RepID=T1PEN9_MUSDO|nr:protein odr-4 homolog [Musca domestica]